MKKKNKKKIKPLFEWPHFNFRNISLLLIVTTFLAYTNTLGHQYVLDDAILITDNSLTQRGLSGILEIFKHDTFYGFFKTDDKANLVSGGRYRPLSQILFAIEYSAFGLNPFWGHLFNVLFYCLCSFTTFFFVYYLLGESFQRKEALFIAAFCAILFALHPIHTEVVANIKGRDEILALLLSLWSAYFAIEGTQRKKYGHLLFATTLFFLAMLAKEVSVGFLVVVPLAFFLFRSTKPSSVFISLSPLLIGFSCYMLLRVSVLGFSVDDDPPLELMNNPFLKIVDGQYVAMTMLEKIPQIIYGLGKYVQLTIFPHPLTHDYYPQHLRVESMTDWRVVSSLLIISTIMMWALKNLGRNKIIFFSIIFFFATLFITANIIIPVGTHLSERFLFTPSLGACLLVGFLILQLFKSKYSFWVYPLLLVLILGSVIKTIDRNSAWQDNFTLFTTDVAISARSAKAQNAAGGTLIDKSRSIADTTRSNAMLHRAISHLEQARSLHPNYKNAYLLLGNANFYLRRYEAAVSAFDEALRLDPNYETAKKNRAFAQRDFGRHRGEKLGDLDGAIELLEKAAVELKEDYETHRLLGVAHGNMGNTQKAIANFLVAVNQRKDDASTLFNLGMAYHALGDSLNANRYISQAKQINPDIGR